MRAAIGYLLFVLLFSGQAMADEAEMTGFVTNSAISRTGHEFYRLFSERLNEESQADYNLSVKERPDARWGSLIWVEYEGRTIYRRFLQPSGSDIKAIAYDAAEMAIENVQQTRIQAIFEDTYDLGKDEL